MEKTNVLTYGSGKCKSQDQQPQHQSPHPVFGRVFPLSEPRSSPFSPEPQHNYDRDLGNVLSPLFKRASDLNYHKVSSHL